MMRTTIFRNGHRPPVGRVALMLLLALGLGLALLLLVPALLHIPSVNHTLFRHLETRTGQRIVVNRMELRLLPRPRLHFEEVQVYDPASQAAWLSAERVDMTLLFWPLMGGQFESDYLVIERPHLTARHSQWEHWRINENRTETTSATTKAPLNFLTLVRNLLIVNGTATIMDEAADSGAVPMQIASLQVTVSEDIPGRRARFQLSGEVPQRGLSALFSIELCRHRRRVSSDAANNGYGSRSICRR